MPTVFYKSCFEFDHSNMVSMLSFAGKSLKYLLQDQFSELFSADYPVFYFNKI